MPTLSAISWTPGHVVTALAATPTLAALGDQRHPALPRLYLPAHLCFVNQAIQPVTLSAHYRAIILDALPSLPATLRTEIRNAHSIWHFIEAVSLSPSAIDALRIWHREELPREFWPRLAALVARGDIGDARVAVAARLRDDPEWPQRVASVRLRDGAVDPLAALEHMLTSAPPRGDAWLDWQASAAAWAGSEELVEHPEVRDVMGILGGDHAAIARMISSWRGMVVACVLYGPLRDGVTAAVAAANEQFGTPEAGDAAMPAAALGDFPKAVDCLHDAFGPFFSAHVCDLLVRAEKMADNMTGVGCTGKEMGIREFYVTEYATMLEGHRGCWRVAADYYLECPRHGAAMLVDLLSRVPIQGAGDPTAEKLLLICDKLRLGRRRVCERIAANCQEAANQGGAMAWFARGGVEDRAISVAEQAIICAEREGACSTGATTLAYVVTALEKHGVERLREQLDYCKVYHEMQESLARLKEGVADASVLGTKFVATARTLVGGGGLARKHWCVVAYEAGRVLQKYEGTGLAFSRDALIQLLSALELASGPCCSETLRTGLRARLRYDDSPLDVDDALDCARAVLLRLISRRVID